jgi:hypothetical protein
MSEVQLDLFNDTEIGRGNVKPGDGLKIWYTGKPEPDYADLDCTVESVDGYGEIDFYVHNGAWEGTLYTNGSPILKVHYTGKVFPVNRFEIIEKEIKETKVAKGDDMDWDNDIAF